MKASEDPRVVRVSAEMERCHRSMVSSAQEIDFEALDEACSEWRKWESVYLAVIDKVASEIEAEKPRPVKSDKPVKPDLRKTKHDHDLSATDHRIALAMVNARIKEAGGNKGAAYHSLRDDALAAEGEAARWDADGDDVQWRYARRRHRRLAWAAREVARRIRPGCLEANARLDGVPDFANVTIIDE